MGYLLLMACTEYDLDPKADVPAGVVDTASCPDDWFNGNAIGVQVDENCLREPGIGSFNPVTEWQWSDNPFQAGYHMVMTTPMVGNLTDDNGDGHIDEGDIPDIAFTAYAGTAYSSPGSLVVISGDGSGTHWSISDVGGVQFQGAGGVALGDFEGDGIPEVCAAGVQAAVICVHGPDASPVFSAGAEHDAYAFPAFADLDADGRAELIVGNQVFDSTGTLLMDGSGGTGRHFSAYGLDWDNDGLLEVVAGNTIYHRDGSILLSIPLSDGYTATADFDADGLPDLIMVESGQVSLVGNDGSIRWQAAVPGGGGGPPTIADFDADGQPEVGVASLSAYAMFDTDGTLLWQMPTEDDSSSVTGSAVFDFEGDGQAEVVYADEHNLWIYDGATGTVLLQDTGHASGTLMEYPIIADVDGDGSTEIIVGSNNMWWEGWTGITVIGDSLASWAPARPVWNQHAYHITNINNDLTIPAIQQQNWLSWNDFRAGGTELGPSHWQADLELGGPDTCAVDCEDPGVRLYLPLKNNGLAGSTEVFLRFHQDSPTGPVVAAETVAALASGDSLWLGEYVLSASDWGTGDLYVIIDDDNSVDECDESNNVRNIGPWPCTP